MELVLLPIKEKLSENAALVTTPQYAEVLEMTMKFFARVGYSPPWIGYFVTMDGTIVGSAAFKGRPMHGRVEIAYGSDPAYRHQGIGTEICRLLVAVARETDPLVVITARTLPEENFSTRILKKNNFMNTGVVTDPDDGEVWEWIYTGK